MYNSMLVLERHTISNTFSKTITRANVNSEQFQIAT